MMWWWGTGGMSWMWIFLIFGCGWFFWWWRPRSRYRRGFNEAPLEIARRRYAGGEISREEYEDIRKNLEGSAVH
jgi:putative membrane protein